MLIPAGMIHHVRLLSLILGLSGIGGCASTHRGPPAVADGAGRQAEPARGGSGVLYVSGEVLGVDRVAVQDQNLLNLRLRVTGDPAEVRVQLGPGWFLDQQGLHFETSEHVTVQGSRLLINGIPTVVATEVTKDGRTIQLPKKESSP